MCTCNTNSVCVHVILIGYIHECTSNTNWCICTNVCICTCTCITNECVYVHVILMGVCVHVILMGVYITSNTNQYVFVHVILMGVCVHVILMVYVYM